MGKFSLLTTLSLSVAGFDKGINQATQKTQQFKKGTEQASKAIGQSFNNLSGILGGAVNSQLGVLGSTLQSGIGAFRSMIPAINGVKAALISSGIGAIVVAIGLAFAALSSYLTGTQEGSDKLNVILGYLKGTFTAIIKRVNLMGSALLKLFQGDFKGMKEDFQEAFKGGLFDEIKDSASQYAQFAEEANKLKRQKLQLDSEEVELQAKMSEYQTDARNKNASLAERQKKQLEFKKLDAILDEKKQKYLYADWQLQEKINASKGKSVGYADLELALQKKKAYYDELSKDAQEQATVNKIDFQLANTEKKLNVTKSFIETKEDEIKTLEATREKLYAEGKSIDFVTGRIMFLKKQIEDFNSKVEGLEKGLALDVTIGENISDELDKLQQGIYDEISKNPIVIEPIIPPVPKDFTLQLNEQLKSTETIAGLAGTAIQGLGDNIIAMAQGGEASFKDMIGSMLAGLRNLIYGLLAEALANTIINALNPKNPANQATLGLAGIAAAAVGITAVSALWAKLPKFATGGIVGGGSYSGDNLIARVNSGEMILNKGQQKNLFDLVNSGGSGVGEVRFEIEGDKLVGVLNRYNRKVNSYS